MWRPDAPRVGNDVLAVRQGCGVNDQGDVFVPGTPRPQGSMKAYIVKGRANVTSDNKQLGPWRADVAAVIRSHVGPTIAIPTGPVCVAVEFVMPRRAAEPKRVTPAHTRKPDLDKMLRACLDAITGLVFTDDSQVDVLGGMKRTAEPGEQPGAWIRWSAGTDRPQDAPSRPLAAPLAHQRADLVERDAETAGEAP